MAKTRRNLDSRMVQLTLPLSSLPTANMAAGSLRRLEAVHEAVVAAIKASGLTRAYIAKELSRLTGGSVSETCVCDRSSGGMKPVGNSGVRPSRAPRKNTAAIADVRTRCLRHHCAMRMYRRSHRASSCPRVLGASR